MENTSDRKVIIVTKTDNSGIVASVIMALLISVIFLAMLFFAIYIGVTHEGTFGDFLVSIATLILIMVVPGVFALLLIDDVVWKAKGKEIISFDSKALYCIQKRLFDSKEEIPWDEIKEITLYEDPKLFQIVSFFTLNGYNNYPTLRIRWLSGKKTKLGINLSDKKRRELAKTIMQLKKIYTLIQKKTRNSPVFVLE